MRDRERLLRSQPVPSYTFLSDRYSLLISTETCVLWVTSRHPNAGVSFVSPLLSPWWGARFCLVCWSVPARRKDASLCCTRRETSSRLAGNVSLANTSPLLPSIANLKPNQKGPEVVVKGRSLMPACHFEQEDSDYITAQRRNPELQGPKGTTFDLNTRVTESAATGARGRNSR